MEDNCKASPAGNDNNEQLYEEDNGDEATNGGGGASTVSKQVEKYLNSVNNFITDSYDPKLKREYSKLADLLASYKNLCNRLSNKNVVDGDLKALKRFPEIYAILQPELYIDIRESEKEKLVSNFAKKGFSEERSQLTTRSRPSTPAPTWNLYDLRQNEKERFAHILATSVPALLHNLPPPAQITSAPATSSRGRWSLPSDSLLDSGLEDIRDKEKERLARIFATTVPTERFRSQSNRRSVAGETQPSCMVHRQEDESPMAEDIWPQHNQIFRAGEYSPLYINHHPDDPLAVPAAGGGGSRHLQGFGEFEGRRKVNMDKKKKEYRDYLTQAKQVAAKSKMDKVVSAVDGAKGGYGSEGYANGLEGQLPPRRFRSTSTQTETNFVSNNLSPAGNRQAKEEAEGKGSDDDSPVSPIVQHNMLSSPRDKLISDLQGVSNFFSSLHDVNKVPNAEDPRLKQAAYAEALRAQILEKRLLDAERKRREQEEEEAIERKAMEQQERLAQEYKKEQAQKVDWIQQKAAQEEILRQGLLKMELEAQKLKKDEHQKKRSISCSNVNGNEPTDCGQDNDQNLTTASDLHQYVEHQDIIAEGGGVSPRLERLTRTPLVEADTQNVLSDKYISGVTSNSAVPVGPRPTSPILPALRTESLLKKNSQLLVNKWMLPPGVDGPNRPPSLQLPSTSMNPSGDYTDRDRITGMRRGDTVLMQLGAFRRQLQVEHARMSRRLQASQGGGVTSS